MCRVRTRAAGRALKSTPNTKVKLKKVIVDLNDQKSDTYQIFNATAEYLSQVSANDSTQKSFDTDVALDALL